MYEASVFGDSFSDMVFGPSTVYKEVLAVVKIKASPSSPPRAERRSAHA